MSYPCPCCGYLTLHDIPPWTYEICPVCAWEEDGTQLEGQDEIEGANDVCLKIARKNFLEMGAYVESATENVRDPLPQEIPGPKLNIE